MRQWGIECDDGHNGPARCEYIDAATVTEAWVKAHREFHRVNVVFSLDGEYIQAVRQDYSNTTGSGDPH